MNKWLFVGLGNQGAKYEHTRHNLGVRAVKEWVAQLQHTPGSTVSPWRAHQRVPAEIAECALAAEGGITKVLALFPLTNMNASGDAVAAAMQEFNVPIERVVLIHDDIELPFGEVKTVPGGSAAGHNGVRSVHDSLATTAIARVRLGVGRPPEETDVKHYVLQPFTSEEQAALPPVLVRAHHALTDVADTP